MLSPLGPAEQLQGGSKLISASSFCILHAPSAPAFSSVVPERREQVQKKWRSRTESRRSEMDMIRDDRTLGRNRPKVLMSLNTHSLCFLGFLSRLDLARKKDEMDIYSRELEETEKSEVRTGSYLLVELETGLDAPALLRVCADIVCCAVC